MVSNSKAYSEVLLRVVLPMKKISQSQNLWVGIRTNLNPMKLFLSFPTRLIMLLVILAIKLILSKSILRTFWDMATNQIFTGGVESIG